MSKAYEQTERASHWLTMEDGAEIYVRSWTSPGGQRPAAKGAQRADSTHAATDAGKSTSEAASSTGASSASLGIVQLAHGMAEHIHRYDAFAAWLAERGFVVVGNDHRGHGRTGERAGVMGYFGDFSKGDKDGLNGEGFERVMEDMRAVSTWASERWPGAPLVLMGHSMGSMLARRYIQKYGAAPELAGVVIMGTAGDQGVLGRLGLSLARREARRKGADTPTPFIDRIAFRAYNKRVPNAQTDFDWLSRDKAEVAAYVADELCGFVPSAGFYVDLFTGLQRIHDDTLIADIPKDLPLLFISGDADPVGDYGKGVDRVIAQYERHGLRRIEGHMYEGVRHEPLNELNRTEIYDDIFRWLQARVAEKSV